ncbi:MAG: PKD domain-containing protein, partial [Flavitalea sp.]
IAVDGVASWFWDFGDGTTSNLENPTHVYPNVGNYDIRLRVVTNSGCTKEMVYPGGVRTGTPLTPDFVADKFNVCASDPVQFTNLTVGGDQWRWEFGDGTTDTAKNATHRFADTGYVNISLTAFNNRCPSTVTKNAYIRVLPPIARFNYTVDCGNRLRVNFRDSSIIDPTLGNLTYTWTFGNSLGTATGQFPSFTFPGYGRYPVTLTVTNGTTCVHSFTGSVLLIDERASFAASKTEICKDEEFTLTASTALPENIRFYQWQVGNAAPILDTAPTLRYRIADLGTYNVTLVVIDTNYCRDTVILNNYLQVIGPDVDFVPDARGNCLNTAVSFTDRTVSALPITKWSFEFGDGTNAEFARGPFTHKFQQTGVFSVKLTVTDSRGCSSSKLIRDTLIITSPKAGFRADTIFCPGVDLNMIDTSSGRSLTYNWSFGDGTGSTSRYPLKNFPAGDRNYTIALKVTDEFGCSDSVSKTEYVKVRSPKAAFTAADTTGICPPLEARFFLEAKDYQSFFWDFGDGGYPSSAPNPRHFYNTFDVFTAKLVAIGYGGCRDSATHRVTLSNPRSTLFNYDPLEACNAVTVNFNIKVPPYTRYSLFYGDGEVRHTPDTAFSHFYRGPAFFYPSVFLTDSLGCTAYLSQYPPIRVIGARPLFGASNKQFCDTGTVNFSNFTIYNDSISSYNWSFGDGALSNEYSPTHHYGFPGNNVVKLLVRTESGCVDSLLDTINVYRTPVASIGIPDTICINRPTQFLGQLAVADTNTIKWSWNFGNGQVSDQQNPRISFGTVGDYTVTLKTDVPAQCPHDTTKRIYVPPAPTIDMPEQIDIISGAGITLPAVYTGNIIDYKWTPNFRLDCADCPNPYANPIKTQKYNIVVTDRYTCAARDEVTVHVICGDKNLFLPNTFSPNNDGVNDRFYPRGTGLFQIKSLRIFNRWGEMVYEQRNFNANSASLGWDGNHKGQRAPQDTYVYSIEVVCENSEVSTFKGNVTLVR